MVTIEQKLLLFSKLIDNSMNKSLNDELKELEKQYELKIKKNIDEVNKDAKSIEDKALKKAEMKKTESLSRSKVTLKRELLVLKEKYYYVFLEKFKQRINGFLDSSDYKKYLLLLISNINKEIENIDACEVEVYLTQKDIEKHSELIKQELSKNKMCNNIMVKTTNDIMGGIIFVIVNKNVKLDLSIDAVIEDKKTFIMQTIFNALEVGELDE